MSVISTGRVDRGPLFVLLSHIKSLPFFTYSEWTMRKIIHLSQTIHQYTYAADTLRFYEIALNILKDFEMSATKYLWSHICWFLWVLEFFVLWDPNIIQHVFFINVQMFLIRKSIAWHYFFIKYCLIFQNYSALYWQLINTFNIQHDKNVLTIVSTQ